MNDVSDGKSKKQLPRWLPLSLLALTTAALAVPTALLWRQRTATLRNTLAHAPPARRTQALNVVNSGIEVPPPRRAGRVGAVPRMTAAAEDVGQGSQTQTGSPSAEYDAFNSPLYALGAFGLATAAVGVAALAGVWGVRTSLGVENTEEFGVRMRQLVVMRMPALASRIHRPPDADPPPLPPLIAGPQITFHTQPNVDSEPTVDAGSEYGVGGEPWTWSGAEKRLAAAFEKGGFYTWAECAARELEAEGRAERAKRGL